MKGDFTRNTFDPSKQYSQVLMQQGRVQLDADWNEQSALMLHHLRSFIRDLVGPSWAVRDGFSATAVEDAPNTKNDMLFAPGRFYVDGIACDNPGQLRYSSQPGITDADMNWDKKGFYMVYLDVWEQLVTAVEDPALREVALGGPDTTVRSQVQWQVRMLPFDGANAAGARCAPAREELVKALTRSALPRLSAWAKKDEADGHCAVSPDAAYRGAENQLYRVEIHDPGTMAAGDGPTFKWSRENGSVIFPLAEAAAGLGTGTVTVKLAHLGRDEELGLVEGDWVELVDQGSVRRNEHAPLLKVASIDVDEALVTLSGISTVSTAPAGYAFLRRWDQRRGVSDKGVVAVKENSEGIILENGVTIAFQEGGAYRTGDYWLIPARTATGDVEWPPKVGGVAPAVPPHGVEHHYGLLGILSMPAGARKWTVLNCRCALPADLLVCPD